MIALVVACADEAPPGIRAIGRAQVLVPGQLRFDWPGSGLAGRFHGSGLRARLHSEGRVRVTVSIDDALQRLELSPGEREYSLAHGLAPGEHTLRLTRDVEAQHGALELRAIELDQGGWLTQEPAARRLELIGDSTSAGFGALGKLGDDDCYASESHFVSYGAQAARLLGAELSTIAASGVGVTRNYAGELGPTMLELYDRALASDPSPAELAESADAVVVNLGANDINARKGDPGPAFEAGYRALLAKVRQRHPQALILCMLAPTLQGERLLRMQRHIQRAIAAADDRRIVWFEGIGTQAPERYACAYHPDAAQHTLMGRSLAAALAEQLGWSIP